MTVANSAALDYETTPQFSLTVRVADPGGLSDTATVTVSLIDVAENQNRPPVVNNQGFSINENSANGTTVGTVAASDPDGNTLSYSITAGNTSGAFAINASTGALTVANSAVLDYETLTQFSLTVRVADPGGLSDTATVTVSLINVADTATGAANGKAIFQSKCSGCHTHGRGDHLGPDLKNRGADGFTSQFIADPAGMVVRSARGRNLLATWGYVMPDYNLTTAQINDILAFLTLQDSLGPLQPSAPVALTETQFNQSRDLYFNRCAGCHGLYRTGATGPNIGEDRSQWIGTEGLGALLRHGTPRGMPNFGTSGLVTEEEITLLSAFLQLPPPEAPPLPMAEIQASWNLIVPVANRPTAPQHSRNWENFFGVVERDAGKISLFDGDSHEKIARLDVGFAVHILRSSASGRYFYAIGRDGLVTLIDLWSSTPTIVATVKGCHDARSVDGSKFAGFEDRYLIEGCYWPPQYVVYDGLTLEPLARNDVPMQSITGETLPEVRVAAIAASHHDPLWVMALKESGYVGLIDYSQPGFPLVSTIATERFLHDGGWDHSGRYLLLAANASNKMVAVDVAVANHGGELHHRRHAASGPWRQLVRSGLRLGECHAAHRRAQGVGLRRRSGRPSGCRLDGGAGNHPAVGRLAVPQDPSELALGAVRHDPEHDQRQADVRLQQGNRHPRPLLPGRDQRQGDALRVQPGRHRSVGVRLGERRRGDRARRHHPQRDPPDHRPGDADRQVQRAITRRTTCIDRP